MCVCVCVYAYKYACMYVCVYERLLLACCMFEVHGLPHAERCFRFGKIAPRGPAFRRQVTDSGENPEIGGLV